MQKLICFLYIMTLIHCGVFSQDCNLKVEYDLIHKYCEGKNGANLILNVTGGFPPYSYSWNNGANSNIIELSEKGWFQVKITDKKGCVTEFSKEYLPVSALKIDEIKDEGQSNGNRQLVADVSGGIPPYDFYWFGPGTQNVNDRILRNVLPGNYLLMVKDSQNCVLSQPYEIRTPAR